MLVTARSHQKVETLTLISKPPYGRTLLVTTDYERWPLVALVVILSSDSKAIVGAGEARRGLAAGSRTLVWWQLPPLHPPLLPPLLPPGAAPAKVW